MRTLSYNDIIYIKDNFNTIDINFITQIDADQDLASCIDSYVTTCSYQ